MPPTLPSSTPRRLCLLLLLLAVAGAWARPLADPDEGRYGEAAREMLASGDWLLPREGGVLYPDKPPGVYWLMALGMGLSGPGTLPLRLPSLVSLALLLLWIRRRGARGTSPGTGLTAALIAVSCPLFLTLGQLATLDMTLTLCVTGAILSGRDWLEGGGKGTGLLAGLALGAGFLVKGPVAWLIPLAVLGATALWERHPARLVRLFHPLLLLPMLAVGLSWYLAAASAEPALVSYWWNREFLGRIASDVHSRARPFWYFPALAAAVLLPWWSIPAWRRFIRPPREPDRTEPHPDRRLFAVWGLLPILLFSLPPGKQPGYLAPAVPGLALGLASWWTGERLRRLGNRIGAALLVLEAGLMAWFSLPAHARSDDFDIVAVNDITDAKTLSYLLRYDSVLGRFPGDVEVKGDEMTVDGDSFRIFAERSPADLPWDELQVDVVVESTGVFRSRDLVSQHIDAGATWAVVSAPMKDAPDYDVVFGVNDDGFDPAQ
ncbi:MAG: glyceraldehyde 3-phosphate dehydrogenase NAD-binding domain-containing protein, partial [Planctomycetota bacterium]